MLTPKVGGAASIAMSRKQIVNSLAILDVNNPRPSRIVFCEREGEETQALPVQGTSMAVIIDDIEPGEHPSGECIYSRRSRAHVHADLLSGENVSHMMEEGGAEVASRGTRGFHRTFCIFLLLTNSRARPQK